MTSDERWTHQQRTARLQRFARMGAQDRIIGQPWPPNFDAFTPAQQVAYVAGRNAANVKGERI